MAQINFPSHNEDLEELEIALEIQEIKVMPKVKVKEYVNEKVSKTVWASIGSL